MEKKKNKKGIKALCLILVLIILGSTGYTYAKYVTQEKGKGSADIATWAFEIVKEKGEIEKTINLKDTATKATLKDGKIAPGSSGDFRLSVDATGSEVGIDYTVEFNNEKNKPTNLVFTYNNIQYQSLSAVKGIKGTIGVNENRKREIIVKWEWPYETGENADAIAFNDKKDTQDAIADLDYTFDVVVTGTQSK